MNALWRLVGAGIVLLIAVSAAPAADERPLEFVHALQAKDYNDVAVEYLKRVKAEPNPPADLMEVWDLEMSKSLRGQANHAYNPQDFEQLISEAQKHLEKFVKEKPSHPEAVAALVSGGSFAMDRAMQRLKAVKALGDKEPAQKTKLLGEAREAVQKAKPQFLLAANRYYELRNAMPKPDVPAKRPAGKPDRAALARAVERERLEVGQANAEFQAALSDYWLAQTLDPTADAAARKDALASAEKAFDAIWQRWRTDRDGKVNPIGLTAHMWTGKCADERGDYETAADIYQEVLGAEDPEAKVADKILDPLFAEVEQAYLAIVRRTDPEKFLQEAKAWLDQTRRKSERYPAYQAITLEVAKEYLAMAEKAAGAERPRNVTQGLALLAGMTRIPSPSQQEAFALRRKWAGGAKDADGASDFDPSSAKTFNEAIAMSDQAAGANNFPAALAGYRRALELASTGTKDAERVAKVHEYIVRCQLRIGEDALRGGKAKDCLDMCRTALRESPQSPLAPDAGSLAIKAALALYAAPGNDADAREKALAQLEQICQFAEKTWPGQSVADEARLARGKAALLKQNTDEAIKIFDMVNAKSPRYASSLYLTALASWQRYLRGKRDAAADKAALEADRARTSERASAAVAEFRKRHEPGKPMTPDHIDAQRLLAEVAMDAKDVKAAIAHVGPLVDAVKATAPNIDGSGLSVLLLATRAYLADGNAVKVAEVGQILSDSPADMLPVNIVLVQFAQRLDDQRKAAATELSKAETGGDAKAIEAAKARVDAIQKRLAGVVARLAARKQHSLNTLMIVADLSESSNLPAEARRLYEQILAVPRLDKKAENRANAKLAGLLRLEGQFDKAYERAQKLAQDNPTSLEPQIELARILQSWGDKDPRYYEEAVDKWNRVFTSLNRLTRKPAEYYECIYNAAYCLYRISLALLPSDKGAAEAKAKEGKQWLNSALLRKPDLNGPDTVERYKALLEKLNKIAP